MVLFFSGITQHLAVISVHFLHSCPAYTGLFFVFKIYVTGSACHECKSNKLKGNIEHDETDRCIKDTP